MFARWLRILFLLLPISMLADESTMLRLEVGSGPEDLVLTQDSSGQEVLVTSLAKRARDGRKEVVGFRYLVMTDGKPKILNAQPDTPSVPGYNGTWQGLSWQPRCQLNDGGGVLAATRTQSFVNGGLLKPGGAVDYFRWDCTSGEKRLVWVGSTPVLGAGDSWTFNSVALARDGTAYASRMSFIPGSAQPRLRPEPSDKMPNGAVYILPRGSHQWQVAADQIPGANGLHLSADERTLFVSSSGSGSVLVFERDPSDGWLKRVMNVLKLPGCCAPDNLRLDAEGRLHATGTRVRLVTGIYLLLQSKCGGSLGLAPRGATWTWEHPLDASCEPQTRLWPMVQRGQSVALPWNGWWIAGQMVEDELLAVKDGVWPAEFGQ